MGHIIFKFRRNKAFFVAFAALFALGLSTFLVPDALKSRATEQLSGQLENMSEAIEMLVARSPGERTTAELLKSKVRKAALAIVDDAAKPKKKPAVDDAEPKKRARNIPALEKGVPGVFNDPGPLVSNDSIRLPDDGIPAQNAPGGGGPISNIPGLFPGFPGGGGGGFLPAEPENPIPVPTAPVPEPEVWALMLIGMGFCGYMLRRRNRATGKPFDASCGSRAR